MLFYTRLDVQEEHLVNNFKQLSLCKFNVEEIEKYSKILGKKYK